MLNIILHHMKNISSICRSNSQGWYEIFCPYCGDATRKASPDHGHGFFKDNRFHCFKCSTRKSLHDLLIDTQFTDINVLNQLKQSFPITYYSNKIFKTDEQKNIKQKLVNEYNYLRNNNYLKYQEYLKYIYSRLLDINPLKFYLSPGIKDNKLVVNFYNYYGYFITARFIEHSKLRYLNSKEFNYYYFQDLNQINNYETIVICEGAFDLINLYNYYKTFQNSFFIAICGSSYRQLVSNLISQFLMIGKYHINIVFDQGLPNLAVLKKQINFTIKELNSEIILKTYIPTHSKDTSELMLIKEI